MKGFNSISILRTSKQPCAECGAKNQTVVEEYQGGTFNLYTVTDCKKCGHYKGRLTNVTTAAAVSGEWSRHKKTERIGHEADLLQPFHKDGTINEGFVKTYGAGGMYKEYGLTPDKVRTMQEKGQSVHEING